MLTSWVLTHVLSKINERVHTETSVIKGSGMYSYLTSDWSASDVRGCNGCDCGRIFIPRRFRSLFSRLSSIRSSWKNEVPFAGFWRQALRWILRPLLVLQMTLHFQQVTPSSIVVWATFVSSSLLVLLAGWSVLPVFGIWVVATVFFSIGGFPLGLVVFVLPHSSFRFMDGTESLMVTASMHWRKSGSPTQVPSIFTLNSTFSPLWCSKECSCMTDFCGRSLYSSRCSPNRSLMASAVSPS